MHPTTTEFPPSHIIYDDRDPVSESKMVKNLSRKSSTVFQSQQSSESLPPLPANAASRRADFTMPTASTTSNLDEMEKVIQLLSQKLEKERITFSDHQRKVKQEMRSASYRAGAPKEYKDPLSYAEPFCDFLEENPTVYHVVESVSDTLEGHGYKYLNERDAWKIQPGGKYFVKRNDSALIAFVVGDKYESGNGAAVIAGHIDSLAVRLKPVSKVPSKAGFTQLGVAPYSGGLNTTWWDRDLGIGGRVLVREGHKVVTKFVKLGRPIARVPTLAPHFGAPSQGPFNPETQMVPIIGLESADNSSVDPNVFKAGTFAATQPPRLFRAIAKELGISEAEYSSVVNWELELFDFQPASLGGLDKELIFAGRIDDKMCSWAAIQGLLNSDAHTDSSGIIKVVGIFDDEEIGSLLRQGAHSNFLPTVIERAVSSLSHESTSMSDLLGRTYANSYLVSSDVCHAVNPNFLNVYLENHAPELNVGVAVSYDPNGHMTTDGPSVAVFEACASKADLKLQKFQIRNDSRSGGTVGPMLSSATGMRAIDAGIPQLSMHSIRATTGSLDPGLGVNTFQSFLDHFEEVDQAFR